MKNLIMLMVMPLLFACTSEDVKEESKDCNCNRVVEVLTLNVVAAYPKVGVTKMYKYTTINDCTGIQRESSWGYISVVKGECK